MTVRKMYGLMQLRGMGTAYYLAIDGSWVANGRITNKTDIRLWPTSAEAEAADVPNKGDATAVEWHADPAGKAILYGKRK